MIKTTLKITGMACSMCEAHINGAIRNAFDVKKVTSSHKKGETVILSASPLDESALATAITKTGYTLTGIASAESTEKTSLFSKIFG